MSTSNILLSEVTYNLSSLTHIPFGLSISVFIVTTEYNSPRVNITRTALLSVSVTYIVPYLSTHIPFGVENFAVPGFAVPGFPLNPLPSCLPLSVPAILCILPSDKYTI